MLTAVGGKELIGIRGYGHYTTKIKHETKNTEPAQTKTELKLMDPETVSGFSLKHHISLFFFTSSSKVHCAEFSDIWY